MKKRARLSKYWRFWQDDRRGLRTQYNSRPRYSNEEIEAMLSKISHLVHGAKLLGAGGG